MTTSTRFSIPADATDRDYCLAIEPAIVLVEDSIERNRYGQDVEVVFDSFDEVEVEIDVADAEPIDEFSGTIRERYASCDYVAKLVKADGRLATYLVSPRF